MDVSGNNATLHGNDKKGMELKSGKNLAVHGGLTFDHFKSSDNGAVLKNAGTVEIEGDSSFKNNEVHNSSNSYGGAVYNDQNGQLKLQNGNHTFENNTAKKSNYAPAKGGALYNEGTVEMSGTNTFKGNKASDGYGGAIHNEGNMTLDGITSFVENTAEGSTDFDQGGAISNHKNLTITGQKANFEKNKALAGGAVYNDQSYSKTGVLNIETEETVFSENKAQVSGGAIANGTDVNITGHSTFKANEANYGGAISNNGGNVNLNDVVFEDNVATLSEDPNNNPSLGGAISNNDIGSGYNHDKGIVNVHGTAEFTNNQADVGGAIYNAVTAFAEGADDALVTFEKDVDFSHNNGTSMGGAIYNAGAVTAKGHATFEENKSDFGGAIINSGGTLDLEGGSDFKNNTAASGGGAIYNWSKGEVNLQGDTSFTSNSATAANGGAIYNAQESNVKLQEGNHTFEDNTAATSSSTPAKGGAIYNAGVFEMSGTNTFKNNRVQDHQNNYVGFGGAIHNQGQITLDGTTSFVGNQVEKRDDNPVSSTNNFGGAVSNNKDFTIKGEKVTFEKNEAYAGGAVYNDVSKELKGDFKIETEKTVFSENKAQARGGAIMNGADLNIGGHATFKGNEAELGGAISNSGGNVTLNDVVFEDNKAYPIVFKEYASEGGALNNVSVGKDSKGIVTVKGMAEFKNNTAGQGGAIHNASGTEYVEDAVITFEKHADFSDNAADNKGGAIYNSKAKIVFEDGSDFSHNMAGKDGGGAIYNKNKGQITLEGETTFTDNVTDATQGGAIYNAEDSDIHIKGNAVFSGNRVNGAEGDFNDIHNDGTIDVAENATLTLDGGVTGSGDITFEDGSALVAKAGKTSITNHVTNQGAELTLVMENGYEGGSVDLIGEGGSLDQDFTLKNNNTFYDFSEGEKAGSYQVAKKSTDDLKDMLHTDDNGAAAAGALVYGRAPEENKAFNDMADAVFAKLQSPDTIQEGLDDVAVMSPEVADLVQQEQTAVSNQIFGAVGSRLSSGTASSWRGMSSGDDPAWVQFLDNHAELDETAGVHGWDSDTYGIALGLEKKINPFFKAGIGYAYGKTDIDGFRRQTDVYTNTGLLYGEYKPSNWFVNGIFSYGWSDYKEKKSIADYLVRAKYDVNTLGMQVMTGYEFWAPYGVKFVPELGMRYLYLDQDDYTDSLGIRITGRTSDVLTAVFGAKISQPWVVGYRTIITPELRIATTYDMKRPDANSVVSLPNGQSYEVSGRPMKRLGVEIGAGVTAEVNDKTDVSANYEGHFRDHYQDHTGLLGVKYKI